MKIKNRREFIKTAAIAGASGIVIPSMASCSGNGDKAQDDSTGSQEVAAPFIVPRNNGLKITGTFLDEISHDIPHQNWGENEWDCDFENMKAIGIDTVIMIRSGYRKFDKLRLKLEAARRAGYDKAITFEFPHFMSPQSAYIQAGHLYNRYKEYFEIG